MTKFSKSSLMIFLAMSVIVLMLPRISLAAPSIIIDHTSVDLYDDLPDNYINEMKKMWFNMPGESHSVAYYNGLLQLQSANSKYKVVVSANPGSGNINAGDGLAINYNSVFGSLWNGSSWDLGAGEEDWFYNGATKPRSHIQHVSNTSYRPSALGLGWCWDAYLTPSDFDNYISATQGYSTYAKSLGSKVYVLFTTGPVDGGGSSARDEKYRRLRNYVASANDEILFDYADILVYNDAGQKNQTTYEEIHPSNAGNNNSHIGNNGELRLAKAAWVLMARLAGWNGCAGSPDTIPDPFTFTDQTGVGLSQTITSNTIPVSGITCASAISITGGTYSINGGSYTSVSGAVNNGDTVTVRQTSSGSYSTTTTATLTIGGVSDTFSVTTQTGTGCSGDVVVLQNMIFVSGNTYNCIATTSITAGTGVTVQSGATVNFKAPKINLQPGLRVESGAVFSAKQ
jgi:hypothetical protein